MAERVRVFIASSLDGFIAGEGDDLSWLPQPDPEQSEDHGYAAFMADIGAMLIGRRTHAVVTGFGVWPYTVPVLVASHRPIDDPQPGVRVVGGPIEGLVEQALDAAAGRDVYLDGGELIRQALDAGCIDEMIVTIIPIVLGRGRALFAGAEQRRQLALRSTKTFASGLVQLCYSPIGPA